MDDKKLGHVFFVLITDFNCLLLDNIIVLLLHIEFLSTVITIKSKTFYVYLI